MKNLMNVKTLAAAISSMALLVACGGGSSSSTSASNQPNTPTAVLQSTGNATQYALKTPAYSSVTGNYTSSMVTAASFTTATPLSPNLKDIDIASYVSTLNIDDGLFSGSTGSIALVPNSQFLVSTDANGNVTTAKLKAVSTLSSASVGSAVNYFEILLSDGSLIVTANNGANCTEVSTSAICQKIGTATSHATANGTATLSRNEYTNYAGMYVFGDSDSDNGRRFALAGYPKSPFWKGRHSDGPVGVEYLAGSLGIPLDKRTDFAVGGATTGTANVDPNPKLANTGMLGQLETFKQQLNGAKADSNALYFIRAGVNDFSQCGYPTNTTCTTAQINQMISNVDTLVKELYALGARNIILSGVVNGVGGVIKPFNTGIKANLDAFKAANTGNFYYYNYASFYGTATSTSNPYGFTNLYPTYCYTGDFSGNNGTVCSTPGTYAFWDSHLHWTTRAMHAWGDSMAALLKK